MPEVLKSVPQPIEAPRGEPLTADYASEIFFHAFKHGQGWPGLQMQFYHQLHRLHPEWKMSNAFREEMKQESWRIISRYPTTAAGEKPIHVSASERAIKFEFNGRANDMQTALNKDNPTHPDQISTLIERLVIRDAEYAQEGRPRFKHDSSNPTLDTKLSFLVHYGLLGNTTGNKDFDQIYKDVKDFFKSPKSLYLEDETMANIFMILRIYNENHPQQQVELPKIEE